MGTSVLAFYGTTPTTITTSWTALVSGGGWDLTIAASAGDVIEVGLTTMWANTSASFTYMDAATIVSGTATNWVSTGTSSHTNGVLAWFQENTNQFAPVGGSWFYTVQSGDIVSGNVTFRLYGKTNTSTRVMSIDSTSPGQFWASKCDNAPVTSSLTGTLSSTSFTAFTGSVTVTATTGDVIACTLSGNTDNAAGVLKVDAATMVSASPTNWFSSGTSTQATGGVAAWKCKLANYEPLTGTVLYTVQSGDVVSGQVTVKIYGAVSTGSKALDASSLFAVRKV